MDLLSIILVIVYLMVTGYLGYLGYRQTKTAADYLVAGRSANPIIMALSYGATFISTSASSASAARRRTSAWACCG
jgi:SSS family solute:Na+ symporter